MGDKLSTVRWTSGAIFHVLTTLSWSEYHVVHSRIFFRDLLGSRNQARMVNLQPQLRPIFRLKTIFYEEGIKSLEKRWNDFIAI